MDYDLLFAWVKEETVLTLKPYLGMAGTGQRAAGQFRVKWLRRGLLMLWWIAAFLTVLALCVDLVFSVAGNINFRHSPEADLTLLIIQSFAGSLGITSLIFDLWVAGALYRLARVWRQRTQGGHEKAKIWRVVAAVAIILGRPSTFLVMFLFSFIPNSWW
ncbi:hypothetical protein GTA51_20105, partial [Desulfovibrio aerotolerans]